MNNLINLNLDLNIKDKYLNYTNIDLLKIVILNLKNILSNKKQNIIGVNLNKSCNSILIIYSILITGNIYLPLDITCPKDKIDYYIEKTNCKYIISDNNYYFNNINIIKIEELFINKFTDTILDINIEFKNNILCNDHIAYILFTSGSTGNPKGTINKLSSLFNHINFLIKEFKFSNNDKLILKTPFSFDASTWEIYLPLFINIKLYISENNDYRDPKKLAEIIINEKINVIQIVPSIGIYLINYLQQINNQYKLKYIFCGGEALSKKLANNLLNVSEKVINLYGPSECCCNTLYYEINNNNKNNSTTLYYPIGRTIYNTKSKIVDHNNIEILNYNIEGELLLSGDAVGLGYINNIEETKNKFIFSKDIIWYKTGDIVKYDIDMNILFCGRIDHQIKLNGQRIDPEEIESVIYIHPYIDECKITIYKNIILCHLKLKENYEIDIKIIKNICQEKLEKFKIPKYFYIYKEFPKLNNDKINISELKTPTFSNNNTNIDNLSKNEIDIHNYINTLLECDDLLDLNTNLFFYGLDSIKSIILKHYLIENYKLKINIKDEININYIFNLLNKKNITGNNDNNINENNNIEKKFMQILENIIIKSNKIIVIHSSFKNFNIEINTLKKIILDIILKYIDDDYTFLIPCFNFSFCKYKYYHTKYVKSDVGVLAEWILELNNSYKTKNPIFSWVVIGKESKNILNIPNINCFGKDTLFDYIYNTDSSYILLDCLHFTQIHYCEELANVPWRYYKIFNGIVNYDDKDIKSSIKMYCRNLDIKNDLGFNYINFINDIINIINIENIIIYHFNTKHICDILIEKLKNKEFIP